MCLSAWYICSDAWHSLNPMQMPCLDQDIYILVSTTLFKGNINQVYGYGWMDHTFMTNNLL